MIRLVDDLSKGSDGLGALRLRMHAHTALTATKRRLLKDVSVTITEHSTATDAEPSARLTKAVAAFVHRATAHSALRSDTTDEQSLHSIYALRYARQPDPR